MYICLVLRKNGAWGYFLELIFIHFSFYPFISCLHFYCPMEKNGDYLLIIFSLLKKSGASSYFLESVFDTIFHLFTFSLYGGKWTVGLFNLLCFVQ